LKTVIVGDIGGQYELFRDVIESVGGNPDTGHLPNDITMIQVGDIVRYASAPALDSLACAQLAQKLIDANEGRYIQLFGNHETPLLGGTLDPHWSVTELPESQPIIQRWWEERLGCLAVTLTKDGQRDILVTHAGLTRGYMEWLETTSAFETARKLNSFVGNVGIQEFERTGGLVTGTINPSADIVWALVGMELHDSWKGAHPEFNQIHGHSCLMEWESETYWNDIPQYVQDATVVNYRDRYTVTAYESGYTIRSVDWVLKNEYRRKKWPLLVLDGYHLGLG
jgi:hypothetical protein